MSGHHRSDSAEVRESRQSSPTLPRATTTPGATPLSDDQGDPLDLVYRAIIENPDFVNKLADVLRANPGSLRGPRGPAGTPGAPGAPGTGTETADNIGEPTRLGSSFRTSTTLTAPPR